jgi:hypothetical protein
MSTEVLPYSSVPKPAPAARRRNEYWALAALTAGVRIFFICIWPLGAYSVDLKDWTYIAGAMVVGINPYVRFETLNWPPLWMGILFLLTRISDQNTYHFMTCIRVFLTIADVGLVLSTYALLRLLAPEKKIFRLLLVAICFNPLAILLTIQQGNFDVLPAIGIVWFLYCLIQFRRRGNDIDWLCAATWLGLATFAKTFPFALIPLLIAESRKLRWKVRLLGAALCVGPAILSLAPLYVLSPGLVATRVIFYRGTPGAMGVSGLLQLLINYQADLRYAPIFTFILLSSLCAITWTFWRKPLQRDQDVVLLAATILIGVFEFGSAYCPQYWMWVLPLLTICYATQSQNFQRRLLIAAPIIVLTGVLQFAYDSDVGGFMAWWAPTPFNKQMINIFTDVEHDLILICLPMTVVTLILWLTNCRLLIASKRSKSP